MAAENDRGHRIHGRPVARFNEAAAHGRGKRQRAHVAAKRATLASMRPRRMAAENMVSGAAVRGLPEASMRPRRMAAENPLISSRPRR